MIEDSILTHLVNNEEYTRKVISFLKPEYFNDFKQKTIFNTISEYITKYNSCPSPEALKIEIASIDTLNETSYYDAVEYVAKMDYDASTDMDWLVDNTEKFCQDMAFYLALKDCMGALNGENDIGKGSLPKLMQDALGVSFDNSVGHDYIDDVEERYEFYHTKEDKIPFDLHYFNEITRGGVSRKTLNVLLAPTGVGKSLFMCHFAAANLVRGKNVLYITMEMAEEKISERIDLNLMNVTVDDLAVMSKVAFMKKMEDIKSKNVGKLIVKEYPTASAGSATFRALLNELKTKRNFVPDIIYIDYLNICISSRIKMGNNVNSYTYIKSIAEELRGLAIEFNVPIVSATQTTRGGANNSDIDITDTSESWGLPATVDSMFAIINDEEMEENGQIMIKQLKNRYSDITKNKRFLIGIDRNHMRLYDLESSAQKGIMGGPEEDISVFDKTRIGMRDEPTKDRFKDLF